MTSCGFVLDGVIAQHLIIKPNQNNCHSYNTKSLKLLHKLNTFFSCNVCLVSQKKRINIYINLILIIIIIIIIILGIFSCPSVCVCVCVPGVCVPGGSRSLLKLSQVGSCWEHGRNWERCRRRSGVGGCSDVRITAVRRPETGRYSGRE